MNSLINDYNYLLDKGTSILHLYIYSLLVNDERTFNMSEIEMMDAIDKIVNYRYEDYGIDEALEKVLNEEIEWDLY